MRNLADVASSPTLSLAGQTTLARVHVSEPRVGRPLLQSGRDDEDAFRGPCEAVRRSLGARLLRNVPASPCPEGGQHLH